MTLKGVFGALAAVLMLALPAAAQGPGGLAAPCTDGQLDPAPGELIDEAQYPGRPGPGPGPMMGHHGPGMRGQGHHGGMRRPMGRPLLTMMLRHRDELGLSAAQVQSLEKLRGDYMREAIRRGADRKIARLDLLALMRPDPADPTKAVDMARVEAKVREIEKLRADLQLARIRAIEAGKAQLTADQRTKLNGLLAQMRSRWQRGGPPPRGSMPPAPPAGPRS
jgi:hypothetical protein